MYAPCIRSRSRNRCRCRCAHCLWNALLPNAPDVGSKLSIGHLDPVELERFPNLVHLSAAREAGLNFRPRPHDSPALGSWSGLGQGLQVRQFQVHFPRSAAAVHGWILGRFRLPCNSLKLSVNSLCTKSAVREAWQQTETVCQQSVNNGIGSSLRKRQQTGVEEHKGTV